MLWLKLRATMFGSFLWLVIFLQSVQFTISTEDFSEPKIRSEEDRKFLVDSGMDPDTVSPDAVIIKPPSYTDEEQAFKGMPKQYRCDGCKILAYQLQKRFSNAEKKLKKNKNSLPESETIDIIESLCKDDFEDYGLLSTPSGEKYLIGEGLNTVQQSGSIDKGALWTERLRQMCLEILDVYDEDEVYEMYKTSGADHSTLERTKLCSRHCKKSNQKKNAGRTEL